MDLILEFDEGKTKEASFAHYCDKLECDIQCKLYDEEGCVDLNDQEGNNTLNDPRVQELMKTGKTWSDMWITFDKSIYSFDKNFTEVINYIRNNKISFE